MHAPRTTADGPSGPRLTGRAAAAPGWVRLAATALLLDLLLLGAHVLHHLGAAVDPGGRWRLLRSSALWDGSHDGSLVELAGCLQLGAAAVVLLLLARRSPAHRVLAAWGVLFLVLAADDLLGLHERAGRLIGVSLLGLDDGPGRALTGSVAQEVGGLVFWTALGAALGAALVLLHRTSAPAARRESWALLATAAPLGVVAAGFVLITAVRPELLEGPGGAAVVLVRTTVKLLTMTALLVQALRLRAAPASSCS